MRRLMLSASVVAAALNAAPALAKGEPSKASVGITAGSLGVGPEGSVTVRGDVAVRANATFLNVSRNFNSDDLTYGGRVKLGSIGFMLDYHVAGSGFVLSGGARINKNKIYATVTPADDIDFGSNFYTPAQVGTLDTHADFKPIAPTFTVGYSGHLRKGVKLGIEAGAMFMGGARVKPITASGGGIAAADLEAERQSLQSDVSKYKVYPVLQLSVGYHF